MLSWRSPQSADDLDALAKLNRQLIRDEGHRNPMKLAQLRERMAAWLAGEYAAAIFSTADAEDVAYALWADRQEHLYLRQFFVAPQARRQGIGTGAFKILKAEAWPTGKRLRLDVLSGNVTAIEFWKAVGFESYALIMEQAGNGDTAVQNQ